MEGVGDPDRLKLRKKEVRPDDDDGDEVVDDCCPALGRYACAMLLLLLVFCAIADVVPANDPGRFIMGGDPTEKAGEVGGSSASSLPSSLFLLSTITPAAAAAG